MKSSAEIRIPNADMDVHGKESVTSMLQSIRFVRSVTSMEFWFRWKRSITSFLWVKVAHMIGVIWLRCASRVIHRYMRSEGIAGMTGRGCANLYRPIALRTAGGSFVRSRKIEYGGITLKNHLQKEVVLLWIVGLCFFGLLGTVTPPCTIKALEVLGFQGSALSYTFDTIIITYILMPCWDKVCQPIQALQNYLIPMHEYGERFCKIHSAHRKYLPSSHS